MARGGDSETGGGASVHWKVDAGKVEESDTDNRRSTGTEWHQHGRDQDGVVGTDFTVSIKPPRDMTAGDYLVVLRRQLDVDGGRVYFNLPIEDDKKQVRISWGDSENHSGNGGKKSIKPAV